MERCLTAIQLIFGRGEQPWGTARAAGQQLDDGNLLNGDCCSSTCQNINEGGSCADADLCDGTETCQSGVCTAGTPLTCDDTNACTDDTCAPATGCVYTPDDTTTCADADLCDGTETCQ